MRALLLISAVFAADEPLTSADWTVDGSASTASFASDLSGAGDVNGDGFEDVIVGSSYALSSTGQAFLYLGSSEGVATSAATTLTGDASGDSFGWAVGGAGDVDGDGYDEVIVGAHAAGVGGKAYLFPGSSAGISSTEVTVLSLDARGAGFGRTVASAGDVNGDGHDDVLISAVALSDHIGQVLVYRGSSEGLSTTPAATLSGVDTSDYFGIAISTAGDVNADGYDDILVGASRELSGAGQVYVYLGSAEGVVPTPALTLAGAAEDDFGLCVSGAGDLNADGFGDVLIGAFGADANTGRVEVYLGSSVGLEDTPALIVHGSNSGAALCAVAGLGDVNGDGRDDFATGAPGMPDEGAIGTVDVYLGTSEGLPASASTTLSGEEAAWYGHNLGAAGDVNNDGYQDLLVGLGYLPDPGAVEVHYGSSDGIDPEATTTLGGSQVTWLGYDLAGVGDVTGDGYLDVVIGSPGSNDHAQGRIELYVGSADGLSAQATSVIQSKAQGDDLGASLARAGDVNGDGFQDVIVGVTPRTEGQNRADLYLGAADGLSSDPVAQLSLTGTYRSSDVTGAGDLDGDGHADIAALTSIASDDDTGRWYLQVYYGDAAGVDEATSTDLESAALGANGKGLAEAGDVDGDGYDDLIVSAGNTTSWIENEVYLLTGSASGLSTSVEVTLTASKGTGFGEAISGAGDVNGDGYDDVVIGAPYEQRAYLYFGATSGLEERPATTLTGGDPSTTFALSLAGAGDVDDDGHDDVIVGDPGLELAYVYPGSTEGLRAAGVTAFGLKRERGTFGYAVAAAGDVNGDHLDDVLIGAPTYNDNAGRACLFFGSSAMGWSGTDTADVDSEGPQDSEGAQDSGKVPGPTGRCGCAVPDSKGGMGVTVALVLVAWSFWTRQAARSR